MSHIENTTEGMKDAGNALAFLAASLQPGTDAAIQAQEQRGQAQFVGSDRLPTTLNGGDQAAFEVLGFVFGDPDPSDRLFRPATLPAGWRKTASPDSDTYSYIVDERGRRRATVFYKAAFYDRRAHMGLTSAHEYVHACARTGEKLITDDTWATPAAVLEAAREGLPRVTTWAVQFEESGDPKWAAEERAKAAFYSDLIARYEGRYDTLMANDEVSADE